MADDTVTPQAAPAPTGLAAPAQAPPSNDGAQLAAVSSAMQQSQPPASAQPAAPAQPQAVPVQPNTPHAGLLNMVQSLALGVDAFAKAAATHGQEGGVGEVQDYYAKQQQQKIQAQQAAQEQQESDLRQKTMNANLLMNQMQYQQALQRFPLEMKNQQLELQNNTIDAFGKEQSTGQSMGYDMADPTQAQEAKMRMGVGDASQQPGAIVVPFTGKQGTQDVMTALTAALPPGKSLTDYKLLPSFNDGQHGTGGSIIAVPNSAPLMTMTATPRQIASGQAEIQGMIEKGQAAGLGDTPQFKALVGNFDNMTQVLQNGGKPTTGQLFQMHQSVIGPLAKMVADKSDATKLQEQQDAQAKETIQGQQLRAANNAYLTHVPKDRNGQPTESFDTWQAAQNKAIEQSIAAGDPNVAGKALADGIITLADLKSRGSTPAQILAAVNAATRQTGGAYNASDEINGEKQLGEAGTNTFYGSSRSLVQPNGMLDRLQAAHAALGNTSIPTFNSYKNLLAWHAGSPAQAAFKTALLSASDDYSKVLSGGNPTDSARDEATQVFSRDLSNAGFAASVAQARSGVQSQVEGRIGNNRYLRQREGDILQTAQPPQAAQPVQPTRPAPATGGHPFFSQFGGVATGGH
jgi:hypothetical protein